MNRGLEVALASLGLIIASPLIFIAIVLIYTEDFKSPFYFANRVGRGCVPFTMIKLRSMVVDADKSGVVSTGNSDERITRAGKIVRKLKLDELCQLINVIRGHMALVGPRPNVIKDVEVYTVTEMRLVDVLPGITDYASIVFSDEGAILNSYTDPELAYNQIIRPYKNRLALLNIDHKSSANDIAVCMFTLLAIINRRMGLSLLAGWLVWRFKVDQEVAKLVQRKTRLVPIPPPGGNRIFEGYK